MEVTQMLAIHSILIKIFLGFLLLGVAIPFMTQKNPRSLKKASFVYTLIFQAIITMIAFAGVVAVVTGNLSWTATTTIIMIVVWTILMFIEVKKHKLIKMANLNNIDTAKLLRGAFLKISLIQILLVAIMTVLMILKAKAIIAI